MKRIIALTLVLALMLCGCGGKQTAPEAPVTEAPAVQETLPAATEAPAVTEAPTEATTVPTEPVVYTNPLNGEVIDAPFTNRVFATTLSNIQPALPHVGANQADIIMEMYVNNSVIRCLALFSDISKVPSIGSIRSFRLMFTDLADHYDLIVGHAYGSPLVMDDAEARGLEHMNLDQWSEDNYYSFRDEERHKTMSLEHTLMGIGEGMVKRAEELGYETTRPEGTDYGFRFTENGTPEAGEDASDITINLTYGGAVKQSTMKYDEELGKYVWNQYKKEMVDSADGQKEAFTNVLVVYANIDTVKGNGATYHRADFLAGGEGYFACGGKIIPITWTCDGDQEPLRFFTESGEELLMGVGNTYMAICTPESPVKW